MNKVTYLLGVYLHEYETDKSDGTLVGSDADFGDMFALNGKLVSKSEWIEKLLKADRFEHINAKNADKTPLRARRNGKNKTWKKKPDYFEIPVKYGLKTYFKITPKNAIEWRAAK